MTLGTLLLKVRGRVRRRLADPVARRLRALVNASRTFDPIFVTGAMGSGTTLVARELGQRFDVAGVIDESSLEIGAGSFLRTLPIARFPDVRSYERSLAPGSAWSVERAVRDLLALYRTRARGEASAIVDKAANSHMLRLDFLVECFPEAFAVVVFRDPVANVEGFRRKWPTFARDELEENIRFYRGLHESVLASKAVAADRVLFVEYESLVAEPDRAFASLSERLGLRAARSVRGLENRPNAPGQGLRNVTGGEIRIVKDANDLSYRRLSGREGERIRSALRDVHERLRARATRFH